MDALGAVLGLSWAPLGALLGHLGAILRPRKAIGSEKARKQKTTVVHLFLTDFDLLGGLLGRLRDQSESSWGGLGASFFSQTTARTWWGDALTPNAPC